MIGKSLGKIIWRLLLMFCLLKVRKYILPTFQNMTQIVRKVNLLMISSKERWNYIAVKTPRWFFCLNCLHSFATENKRESQKKVYKKNIFRILWCLLKTKKLEFNQHQISDTVPFIIYADLESLTEKIDGCKNNLTSQLQKN